MKKYNIYMTVVSCGFAGVIKANLKITLLANSIKEACDFVEGRNFEVMKIDNIEEI